MKAATNKAINEYVKNGTPPGWFVRAVLANDLMTAVERADSGDLRDLKEVCKYVVMETPSICWGSYDNVDRWIAEKRTARDEKAL
jgi:hypothetical protein